MKHKLTKFFGGFYYEEETETTYWYWGEVRKTIDNIKWKVSNKYNHIKYGLHYRYLLTKIYIKQFIKGI